MNAKRIFSALALCLIAIFAVGFFAEAVHAQDYMDRKGIEGLFAGGKDMEGKGPTNVQKAIGIGSCIVMIAVVKWL